jgi:NitT/TauT family transport system permease protein
MTVDAVAAAPLTQQLTAPRARLGVWVPPLAVLVAVLGLWQFGAIHAVFRLREFQLPYPSQIAQAVVERADVLWRDAALFTAPEAAAGLIIGGLLGFACAVLFASVAFLRRGALPIAASLNSIPIIAASPIAVLWLGFGQPSKIAVVALMVFAPMVINAFKGLYSIEREPLELMTSLAASPRDVFWKLRLPHALPYVFSALKVGTTLAMIGALVAEFFNAQHGLGVTLSNNIQVAKMPIAWAAIVVAALLGLCLYALVSLIERAVIPWHVSIRVREGE